MTAREKAESTAVLISSLNENTDRRPAAPATVENLILIWFDPNIHESTSAVVELRQLIHRIEMFDDFTQCLDYIQQPRSEKLMMIISTEVDPAILSSLHNFTQLQSIYVFGEKISNADLWMRGWRKVKGVFMSLEHISHALKCQTQQSEEDLSTITVASSTCTKNTSDELDQSFMYSQLLQEILLSMYHPSRAKADLVNFCRERYADNPIELRIIDEFARDYSRPSPFDSAEQDHSPIWWYTRECFIYSTLNKALRTLDVDVILRMGFLIQDIHRQIQEVHLRSRRLNFFLVYRGQGMLSADFERIRENVGGLLSFNSFLSTSTDRSVALGFAQQARANPELTALLFEMKIDPFSLYAPLGAHVSYFEERESEILFSMNTVFRIGQIRVQENKLWEVQLTLTEENDRQLQILAEQTRTEIGKGPEMDRIGCLLAKMGKYEKAEEIYTTLLKSTRTADWPILAHMNNQLGYIAKQKGDLIKAQAFYETTLEIQSKNLPWDDLTLATTHNNIGTIYDSMQEYSDALRCYQKALEIRRRSLRADDPLIAIVYNNIGLTHHSMGDCSKALSFFQQALTIQKNHLSANDPSLATTYNNLGKVHRLLEDYPGSLWYYEKACSIYQKSLPSDHPKLATVYNNLGHSHDLVEDYPKALEYYQMTLDIQQKSLPANHSSIATTYNNLGFARKEMKQYKTALFCFKKALQIEQQNTPVNHEHVQELRTQISLMRVKQ